MTDSNPLSISHRLGVNQMGCGRQSRDLHCDCVEPNDDRA
jgi:hypothetical protein